MGGQQHSLSVAAPQQYGRRLALTGIATATTGASCRPHGNSSCLLVHDSDLTNKCSSQLLTCFHYHSCSQHSCSQEGVLMPQILSFMMKAGIFQPQSPIAAIHFGGNQGDTSWVLCSLPSHLCVLCYPLYMHMCAFHELDHLILVD